MAGNELILFESQDKSISLNVPLRNDSVWLNRNQMAELFDRDVKTIGKHVNNAIREELGGLSVVAKFATVQQEGDRRVERWIEYYNLDVIISVGYRVKSQRGVEFRKWAKHTSRCAFLYMILKPDMKRHRIYNPMPAFYITMSNVPPAMRMHPRMERRVSCSWSSTAARMMVITTLCLSIGMTFDTSPI